MSRQIRRRSQLVERLEDEATEWSRLATIAIGAYPVSR
jgi:hypothetical protein